MPVIPSTEISHRADFAILCNVRKLHVAVEVGTDMGVFAKEFLSRWNGHQMFLVDDYQPYGEMPFARTGDLMTAVAALLPYHGRYKFIMGRSLDVARSLPPWFRPQFVYIDASHEYEHVRADIAAWWEVLGPDGVLAGHDCDDEHPGVLRAVTEFAEDRLVRLTTESSRSWYAYRTEPDTLVHRYFRSGESPNS